MWLWTVAQAAPVVIPDYDPSRSLAPLVEAVSPAVVSLEVESGNGPDLPEEILRRLPFDPHQFPRTRTGEGSGFFVSDAGELVTNWHVVEGASSIVAVTSDGRRLPARVLGSDQALDVALLQVDGSEPWLSLAEAGTLRVGDWVVAMGNALGLGSTATVGIVSGRGRTMSRDLLASEFLQTDAAINEGNSGGPVFGLDGSVLGMSTATIQGANTVGFAIPAHRIRQILDDLRTAGKVQRGYLGIAPGDGDGGGATVVEVTDDGPADTAGLLVGDRILRVDGQAIDDARDLVVTIAALSPGHRAAVDVSRGNKERTLEVQLGARPSPDDRVATTEGPAMEEPRAVVTEEARVQGLTLRGARPSSEAGVTVAAVDADSAFRGRLEAADRITSVNHRAVNTPREVVGILARSSGDVTFEVERAGARKVIVARLPD